MLQVNELRVGNYYKPKSGDYAIITEILEDRVYAKYGNSIFNTTYEYMTPIPLTEEILLKCGFEKERMSYSINIDNFGGGKKLSFSGDYLYIVDSEKQNTIPTDIVTL